MKRLLIGFAAVIVAILILGGGALMLVDVNHFRPQIQARLSNALGREVTLGKLHVSVWSGSLDADNIRIGDDPAFGSQPFVSAQSLALGIRLWPLLVHQQLRITSLTLDNPSVRLLQNPSGRWNFASFGGTGAVPPAGQASAENSSHSLAFSVDKLHINNGSIELKRSVGGSRSYTRVQLSAEHVGSSAAFPFSIRAAMAGGGTLEVTGTLGPWSAKNAVMTPLEAHLAMHDLNLVGAGLMSSGDGVGGVLDLDTRISSTRGVLQSKGVIEARQLKLVAAGSPSPRPIRIDYQASYQLSSGTGKIDNATLGSGAARLAVSGSFDNHAKIMQLDLRISGKQLPVDDLQPLLPAFGVVLPEGSRLSGGSLGVELHARGPLDKLVISVPVTLDHSRLLGFSLGSKLGGALLLAGIKAPQDTVITHARASLKIDPSGIDADPASADIADLGSFNGKGGMAASGKLDFRMLVKLDKAITGAGQGGQGLGGLLGNSKAARMLGGVLGGTTIQGIGVRIGGTASAPTFKLDPGAVAGLIEAGVAGGKNNAASTPRAQAAPTRASNRKDVLNDLLRGMLKPKKDAAPTGQ